MYEIERKFRLTPDQYQQLKGVLGAEFGEPHEQHQKDVLFLEGGKNFGQHVTEEPLMRLRDQDGMHLFTYKRTLPETGNRIEHETEIGDPEVISAIIRELGWDVAVKIEKLRLEYNSRRFTYALDELHMLGQFIEIEYISPKDDPNADAILFAEARRLGIDPETQVERQNYGILVWKAAQL